MDIRNQGQGAHAREIHGLGKLRQLPERWYAYTNLEVSVGRDSTARSMPSWSSMTGYFLST